MTGRPHHSDTVRYNLSHLSVKLPLACRDSLLLSTTYVTYLLSALKTRRYKIVVSLGYVLYPYHKMIDVKMVFDRARGK